MRDIIGGNVEPTYLPGRQGDVRDSQADISKAKALLGYEPIVSVRGRPRPHDRVVPDRSNGRDSIDGYSCQLQLQLSESALS